MATNIFVISDLHIGDGGPRDNFGHSASNRPQQLMGFLDYVERQNGEIIILGDLFEFWQASISKVVLHNKSLLDRLAQFQVTYVLGNHDADLFHFIGKNMLSHPLFAVMTPPVFREIGGRKFKFMHGHEVDPFNAGDTPGWGRMMAIFAGICEDKVGSPMVGNDPLESLLTRIGEWLLRKVANAYATAKGSVSKSTKKELTPAQNPDRAAEMLLLYAADRKAEGYDILVTGHTHQPGQMEGWYFNSGSWATTDNNFVRITPSGDVQVFNWKDGKAESNNTTLILPKTAIEAKP